MVRAPPCHGGGCGFEPRRLRALRLQHRTPNAQHRTRASNRRSAQHLPSGRTTVIAACLGKRYRHPDHRGTARLETTTPESGKSSLVEQGVSHAYGHGSAHHGTGGRANHQQTHAGAGDPLLLGLFRIYRLRNEAWKHIRHGKDIALLSRLAGMLNPGLLCCGRPSGQSNYSC